MTRTIACTCRIPAFACGAAILAVLSLDRALRVAPSRQPDDDAERYTVRVNTFERSALLPRVVQHWASCPRALEVHVVWSEPAPPPAARALLPGGGGGAAPRVVVERHANTSLNNRFALASRARSRAVFSVDDDVLVACADVERAFDVWRAAAAAGERGAPLPPMVGFEPRFLARDARGRWAYRPWQTAWRRGRYHLVLSKAAFVHAAQLAAYARAPARTPDAAARALVDARRNCEDLALAFSVAAAQGARGAVPPAVWVRARVRELAPGAGLSTAQARHYATRTSCVRELVDIHGGDLPLPMATQKALDSTAWS